MALVIYKRQQQILDFIKQYIQSRGSAPTLREIANAIGVNSLATVHEHLQTLVTKGLIKRKSGRVRAIELKIPLDFSSIGTEVSILGFIAAGAPIEPYTDPNSSMSIPPSLMSMQKRTYLLQVKGESMIEEQIRDGDYVVIEQSETANNGDIVVALLDTITLLAEPSSSIITLAKQSGSIFISKNLPPVRIAISSSNSFCLSPNDGALTQHT